MFKKTDNLLAPVLSVGQSLGRPTPVQVPPGYTPMFITISLPDNQRYWKQQWHTICVDDQIVILKELIIESFNKIRNILQIPEFKIYYELNKKHNIHIHGIFQIETTSNYPITIAGIVKTLKRICKCNSYGVKVEEVIHLEECHKYCTKDFIDFDCI